MTSVADLYALQEIDLRRDARRALIADIESRLGETEALLEARAARESAAGELERLRRGQQAVLERLEDLDAKIGPLETKLYGGSVRNPKELTDMQHELELLKRQRGKLDDEGLALMEALEAASAALERAAAELRDVEAEWRAGQAVLEADKSEAEAESVRLLQERQLRSQGMEPGALGLYEKLRGLRQGRAVARVERGACQGCRISLPTHLQQRLRAGVELVQCPSCERILAGG